MKILHAVGARPNLVKAAETGRFLLRNRSREVARPAGLEPATLGLEDRCSILLSYGRIFEINNLRNEGAAVTVTVMAAG